jgi:hypothetical protein
MLMVNVRLKGKIVVSGSNLVGCPFSVIPYPFSREDNTSLKELIVFLIFYTQPTPKQNSRTHQLTVRGFMQTFLKE